MDIPTLAAEIAEVHFKQRPELRERYGERGFAHCRQDAAYHLQYLEQSMRLGNPQLFADYVRWAKIMLEARRIPVDDLIANLSIVSEVVAKEVPAAPSVIDAAIRALSAPIEAAQANPHAELAGAYLQAVLAGERNVASSLVRDALARGVPLRDIYLHLFQAAQHEIGRRWQRNEISVADEHLATAITQVIMSQLYPLLFSGPRKGRTFVSACVGGELHEIGARMVADFFEMDGWNTYYLGANTPVEGMVKMICERNADIAGISVTISYNLGAAEEAIRGIRKDAPCSGTKIIVGGYPFSVASDLWKTIGADGYGPDAQQAIELANRLVR